jgi:hypothetical protein
LLANLASGTILLIGLGFMMIMENKYGSVAEMVLTVAAEHGISSELDRIDNMVTTFSRLSGNDVELDDIEILLAHLARKNVISQEEVFSLLEEYLNESKS